MELTKIKFKKTEVGLIPEDWKCLPLVDCVDYIHGKAHEQYIVEFGKYVVVNSKFISSDGNVRKHSNASFCTAKVGDVLTVLSDLPNGKALAKCFLVDEGDKYAVNQRVCIWRAKSISESKFLYYVLNRNKYFLSLNDGVSQTHILNHHIEKCKIPLPPTLTEQKAIATALNDVDEMISKLEKLIEKKKAIKQGAMQQLLTPPHKGGKRLEGFSGEWDSTVFSKVVDLIHGHQFRKEDFVDKSNGVKVIKIGNVNFDKLLLDDCDTIDFDKFNIYEKYQIKEGDVLMSLTGNIGRVVRVGPISELLLQNYRVGKFVPRGLDSGFLSLALGSSKTTKQLEQLSNQAAQANFGKQDFNKVNLDYPTDINEQIAIANCLKSISQELMQFERKLDKLIKIKQGMMQELLTGRTRLI